LLGLDPLTSKTSLYQKPNGSPNWPGDIAGSISHTESTCIVAIIDKGKLPGIGIDIEDGVLETEIERFIVNSRNDTLFLEHLSKNAALRAIFCCKEAVFKSLETLLTERIDFLDIDILYLNPVEGDIYEFTVRFAQEIPCLALFNSELLRGRVYANEQYAASVVVIRPGRGTVDIKLKSETT